MRMITGNIATDLFLSDPDDGVVERSYAQLPGANNRGHKTGWCHTSGMRDPAQTSDSSRNSDMNAQRCKYFDFLSANRLNFLGFWTVFFIRKIYCKTSEKKVI